MDFESNRQGTNYKLNFLRRTTTSHIPMFFCAGDYCCFLISGSPGSLSIWELTSCSWSHGCSSGPRATCPNGVCHYQGKAFNCTWSSSPSVVTEASSCQWIHESGWLSPSMEVICPGNAPRPTVDIFVSKNKALLDCGTENFRLFVVVFSSLY